MSRGQALAEFALVLPVIALLLVMAIDFGRVFFGWVSLTNAARIGANYAGFTPDLMGDATKEAEYGMLIADHVTGCDLDADASDPSKSLGFTDMDGDGIDNGLGDQATVNISCDLQLLTPLASVFLGPGVPMQAEAVFPIRQGTFAGPTGGGGGGGGTPPCTLSRIPDLKNRTLADAQAKWVSEGFDAAMFTFSPSTASSDWLVTDPITFTPTATILDCVDPTGQFVHVTTVTPPPCPSGQAQVPDLIGLLVSDAKTAWTAAGFSGAFKPSNAVDTKTVLTQKTDPITSPEINGCLQVNADVTITYGDPPPTPCDIPNMIGHTWAEAQAEWNAAGFNNALTYKGNNSKNVKEQGPTHPGTVSCDVIGEVKF